MIRYGRHPGETEREAMLRKSADYLAAQERQAALTAAFVGPRRPSLSIGSYSYAPGWQGVV